MPGHLAGETIQGFANATEVLDESAVEIRKSSELPDIRRIAGSRPLLNTLYFDRIHLDTVMGHKDTEVLDLGDFELAFLGLAEQVMLCQSFQDFAGNGAMCLKVVGEDQDVV